MREDFSNSLETELQSKPELEVALDDYRERWPLLNDALLQFQLKGLQSSQFASLVVALLLLSITLFVVRNRLSPSSILQ